MVGHGRGHGRGHDRRHGRGYGRGGGHCHIHRIPDFLGVKTPFLFRGLFGAAGFSPMSCSASLAPLPKNAKEHRDGNGIPQHPIH